MARFSLNDTDDWHTERDGQDIRGWPVHDETSAGEVDAGDVAPHVRDLIFDTDSELVETVVLDDGTEYPARDIEIGDDGVVYLEGASVERVESEPVVETYDAGVRRRESGSATGFAEYEPAFREHHQSTYGEDEEEYGRYHPAYRLGYDYGIHEDYQGRDWGDVEPEARRAYEEQYGENTWDDVNDAARHAFEHARTHHTPAT